jgi:hypothetical protein
MGLNKLTVLLDEVRRLGDLNREAHWYYTQAYGEDKKEDALQERVILQRAKRINSYHGEIRDLQASGEEYIPVTDIREKSI